MIRKNGILPSAVVKRSVKIGGHNTSVTLEDAFWGAVREIAAIQNIGMSELVSRVDKDRENINLSSAIRVFVVDYYQQAVSHRHRSMAKERHEHGAPITLGIMRQLGVRGLVVACLNPQCRHEMIIGTDDYADEIEVPSFAARMVCSKCGSERVDARPNWKEMPIPPPKLSE